MLSPLTGKELFGKRKAAKGSTKINWQLLMKNIYRVESHQSQAGTLPTVEHTISMLYHKDIFSTQGVAQREYKKNMQSFIPSIRSREPFIQTSSQRLLTELTSSTNYKLAHLNLEINEITRLD